MMLLIRNMESDRCRTFVREELNKLGLFCKSVELGEVELSKTASAEKLLLIADALNKSGLELMINKQVLLIRKTKEAIKLLVYLSEGDKRPSFSGFISNQVNHEYNSLSKIFSDSEGMTLEKYFIRQRIDRVKDLLLNSSKTINEITDVLMFSSVAHLSNQFKKITGTTPCCFRQINLKQFQNVKGEC